jgi:hypothetical protein
MGVKLLAVLVLIERALLLGVAWARSGGFHPSGRLIEVVGQLIICIYIFSACAHFVSIYVLDRQGCSCQL